MHIDVKIMFQQQVFINLVYRAKDVSIELYFYSYVRLTHKVVFLSDQDCHHVAEIRKCYPHARKGHSMTLVYYIYKKIRRNEQRYIFILHELLVMMTEATSPTIS